MNGHLLQLHRAGLWYILTTNWDIKQEINEPNKKNKIIGCSYKHSNVPVRKSTNDYMGPLLEKCSHEKKEIILMGDSILRF